MADQEKALEAMTKALEAITRSLDAYNFVKTQGQINDHLFNRLRVLENEKNALKTSSSFRQVHAVLDAALPTKTADDADSTRD